MVRISALIRQMRDRRDKSGQALWSKLSEIRDDGQEQEHRRRPREQIPGAAVANSNLLYGVCKPDQWPWLSRGSAIALGSHSTSFGSWDDQRMMIAKPSLDAMHPRCPRAVEGFKAYGAGIVKSFDGLPHAGSYYVHITTSCPKHPTALPCRTSRAGTLPIHLEGRRGRQRRRLHRSDAFSITSR
ncbi:hypothetical protein F5B21DRAFT_62705 [Xylaria acuta]|nr:hypothetical protein F5B21DRAFT_62705 [Xylaria acuta]